MGMHNYTDIWVVYIEQLMFVLPASKTDAVIYWVEAQVYSAPVIPLICLNESPFRNTKKNNEINLFLKI